MSQKSLSSLLKAQIMDGGSSLRERKQALRRLPCPSRRFLESLIRDQSVPQELRRAASRLLVAKIAPPRPVPTSISPPVRPEETTESAGPEVIDPEVWDLLGGIAGCVRGPEKGSKTEEESVDQSRKIKSGIPRPRNFS